MNLRWESSFDGGTIAWLALGIVAILLLYGPGGLIFYRGLLGRTRVPKRAGSTLELAAALVLGWILWGYSLAFAPSVGTTPADPRNAIVYDDIRIAMSVQDSLEDRSAEVGRGGVIGNAQYFALSGMAPEGSGEELAFPVRSSHPGVPHALFFLHQLAVHLAFTMLMAFPLIGFLRQGAVVVVSLVWSAVVYAPVAHAVWGEGWLHVRGAVDYGGGLLVLAASASALTASVLISRCRSPQADSGSNNEVPDPESERLVAWGAVTMVTGAMFLHCSSSMRPGGMTAVILLNTLVAAVAGSLSWSGAARLLGRPHTATSLACGAVAGIAAVSAGCGVLVPQSAFVLGLSGGGVGAVVFHARVYSTTHTARMWAAQVAASTLGLLGTGIFAVSMFAPTEQRVASGWIESGNYRLLGEQALAVSMALTLPVVVTLFLVGVAIRIGSLLTGVEEKPA